MLPPRSSTSWLPIPLRDLPRPPNRGVHTPRSSCRPRRIRPAHRSTEVRAKGVLLPQQLHLHCPLMASSYTLPCKRGASRVPCCCSVLPVCEGERDDPN